MCCSRTGDGVVIALCNVTHGSLETKKSAGVMEKRSDFSLRHPAVVEPKKRRSVVHLNYKLLHTTPLNERYEPSEKHVWVIPP